MATMEDVVIKFQLIGISQVVSQLNVLKKSFEQFVAGEKFKQNMQGFERFLGPKSPLQQGLKTMGNELKSSMMDGFVKPSKTANQAAQEVIENQKNMANISTAMGRGFAVQGQEMAALGKNIKDSLIRDVVVPSQTAEQAADGILQKQKNLAKFSSDFATSMRAQGRGVENTTQGMRKFKMELLSVMFFGMAINKFFSGLLQPAMKMVGIFDLWGQVLAILFLPVALFLLENVLIPLMDWLFGLDPAVQTAIGGFVLIMAILGQAIFLFGMLGLGINGMAMAFGFLAPVISAIATIGFWPLMAIIAAVIGIVALLWLAWQNNFGRIREWTMVVWEGIKKIFDGIKDVFSGVIDIIVGFFTADGEKIRGGFDKLWEGVKKIFSGAITALVGIVVGLGELLFTAIINAPRAILTLLKEAFGFVWEELLVPAYEFGKNLILKIVEGIKAAASKVAGWVKNALGMGDGGGGSIEGSKQTGGFIPHTGLYKLHAGETVGQAGDTFNSAPNITINAAPGMDINNLVRQISDVVVRDLGTLSRR